MTARDPLNHFRTGAYAGARPVPLVATAISVAIEGGLAIVSTVRTFRNAEDRSIEATMTFPVPVDAVLVGLTAHIGGRLLVAEAKPRKVARATYEDAVTDGKAAVLHEEAIRGIHILTAGHIPPGSEFRIESRWVQPLSFAGDVPGIRIPTTVGHVFGRSPLSETDDLVTGDTVHRASLDVTSKSGSASLAGAALLDGKADIALDAPIDIRVAGWTPAPLTGAVHGRKVTLDVVRSPSHDNRIALSVLIDRSGSMKEASGTRGDGSPTKAEVLRRGLESAFSALKPGDRVALWQFSGEVEYLGEATTASEAVALAGRIRSPSGSTETGLAVTEVISRRPEGDILVLTDGRSHALDVHKLASSGNRISVVLIGEDSLEAMIGHLASLTGGQLFVAASDDSGAAVASAVAACRLPHSGRPADGTGIPSSLELDRGGARISLTFSDGGEGRDDLGAYAAALALPLLVETEATDLACAAGIVSHLTSLVLVDEEGGREEGLPEMRKIALSQPRSRGLGAMRSLSLAGSGARMSFSASASSVDMSASRGLMATPDVFGGFAEMSFDPFQQDPPPSPAPAQALPDIGTLAAEIDWAGGVDRLLAGDLAGMPPRVARAIRQLTDRKDVVMLATATGTLGAVIVLLAIASGMRDNRYATRLVRKFGQVTNRPDFKALVVALGLQAA